MSCFSALSLRWELVVNARSVGNWSCLTAAMPSMHTARFALQLGLVNELVHACC